MVIKTDINRKKNVNYSKQKAEGMNEWLILRSSSYWLLISINYN